MPSRHALRTIRFEGQLLPDWTQFGDLAASLSQVPKVTQQWFSLFTRKTGVDDARTILNHCQALQSGLHVQRDSVLAALAPVSGDSTPNTIYAAWLYALETIIESASIAGTCAWHVEGTDETPDGFDAGGDISLRRV